MDQIEKETLRTKAISAIENGKREHENLIAARKKEVENTIEKYLNEQFFLDLHDLFEKHLIGIHVLETLSAYECEPLLQMIGQLNIPEIKVSLGRKNFNSILTTPPLMMGLTISPTRY